MVEYLRLETDIQLFCLRASCFPDGIAEVHEALKKAMQGSGYTVYGLSRPEHSQIIYWAGSETALPKMVTVEQLRVRKGNYTAIRLKDYRQNLQIIADAFERLLQQNDLDPEAYCVERYDSDFEVTCMIRLKH